MYAVFKTTHFFSFQFDYKSQQGCQGYWTPGAQCHFWGLEIGGATRSIHQTFHGIKVCMIFWGGLLRKIIVSIL